MRKLFFAVVLAGTIGLAGADTLSTMLQVFNGTSPYCNKNSLYNICGPYSDYKDYYESTYDLIRWNSRSTHNHFCIDIADDNGVLYEGMHPLKCDNYMYSFSPKEYVINVMHIDLPSGFAFRWKIWSVSKNADGTDNKWSIPAYGGIGYEGRVVVP